jgi:hypothetical protein
MNTIPTTARETGNGFEKRNNPGNGHDLHGCPSRHETDGFVIAWPRPDVCFPGKEAHRGAAAGAAGYQHRDPMARGAPGGPREQEADEWAKLAAEKPDARGVEWLGYSDRVEARTIRCRPRSLSERSQRRSGRSNPPTGRQRGHFPIQAVVQA